MHIPATVPSNSTQRIGQRDVKGVVLPFLPKKKGTGRSANVAVTLSGVDKSLKRSCVPALGARLYLRNNM